jgi:adenine phosphoribosyltransferase
LFDFGEKGHYLSAALIKEIVDGMVASIKENFENFDYIVAPEPGGHTWGMLLANALGKDINIFRVLPTKIDGEIEIPRKTPYNEGRLYLNRIKVGDRVVIIDDVIYRGGTLASIVKILQEKGIIVVGIQTILAKTEKYVDVEKKYGVSIKSLAHKDFSNDKSCLTRVIQVEFKEEINCNECQELNCKDRR